MPECPHCVFLEKLLTTRFARSSPIEEKLLMIGMNKRDMPTREECLELGHQAGCA